jgi:hypothetical protein
VSVTGHTILGSSAIRDRAGIYCRLSEDFSRAAYRLDIKTRTGLSLARQVRGQILRRAGL